MKAPLGRATWPRHDGLLVQRSRAHRLGRALSACLLSLALTGCADIKAHDTRLRNAVDDDWERVQACHGLNVSAETVALLAHFQLLDAAQKDPVHAARLLEAHLQNQYERDGALALAELSYHVGVVWQTGSPAAALAWYRDAATLAGLALADPVGSRPDRAVEIHNRALARLIRLAQSTGTRKGDRSTWRQILEAQGLALHSSSVYLAPERIADLSVASDYRVEGMDHVYRNNGLGVPLIAQRWAQEDGSRDVQDQFLPRELRVGATAVVSPGGGLLGGEWRRNPATLDLIDPFQHRSTAIGDRQVILASDRTTPLAAQVSRTHFATLEWTGLFESDFERLGVDTGLYMLRPYEPGKIPVIFVHGLVSSPRAWVQVINELQNTPELATRYQFWMFLYPTGTPIPGSAARLREAIVKARDTLDPAHADPALEHIVMVGHSMGGILSKMMAQDSGLTLWDAAITVPRDQFKATPEVQKSLDNVMIFRRLSFVTRLVFIATPHRGSPIANSQFGRAIASMVRRPSSLVARIAEIEALNGPDVISPEMRDQPLNAIDNLRTDSPILTALDRIPIQPDVRYHSIIPLIGGTSDTDGVVEYRSSHLDGAMSERIFAGTHLSQQDPAVIVELNRILREHLAATGIAAGPRASN
jgi:pimeloyl-ACP methyl ester carboxylesterase